MKRNRPLTLSLLCITSVCSFVAEAETTALILPEGTKAISSPLDLEGNKPAALAFAEKGGIYLLPKIPLDSPKTAKIFHLGKSGQNLGNTYSPGATTGLLSFGGSIYMGGDTNFKLFGGGVDKGKIFAKCVGNGLTPISFALGLDGRIYGTLGDSGASITASDGSKVESPTSGAVFRFELDGTGFEIFHKGLINPSGIAFNDFGDAYVIDTSAGTGDKPRLIRIFEDGDSGWRSSYRKQDPSSNRWMIEKMWETSNDSQPSFSLPAAAHLTSSPKGLVFHPGTGFLESEAGRFLVCDDSEILSFGIREKRGGITLVDPRTIVSGINSTGLAFNNDGNLALTDTYNGEKLISIDPGENLHLPEHNEEAARLLSEDFDQLSAQQLAALLGHPNSRVRLNAQISLTRKTDAIETFKKTLESSDLLTRIHTIRGLGIIARRGSSPTPGNEFAAIPPKSLREKSTKILLPLLADPNPEIRVQALRAIADTPLHGDSIPLGSLLSDDSDRVRIEAAITIGKLKSLGQYSSVIHFLAKNNDRDPHLSHAGSFALQHMAANDRQISALTAYDSPAVRLAAVVALRRMGSLEVVRFLNDTAPAVQDEVIRAVIDLELKDAFPMLKELSESSTREWSPVILAMLETAKTGSP